MSASERVAEYLRQRKRQKDLGTEIHNIWSDPKAEMAGLTIPDLEEVLELAQQYEDLCE